MTNRQTSGDENSSLLPPKVREVIVRELVIDRNSTDCRPSTKVHELCGSNWQKLCLDFWLKMIKAE